MSYLLYLREGICQRRVNDLKQAKTAASSRPRKRNEDWWRAKLLNVGWSTTKRSEIHSPAPREGTLPTGLSLFSWASVPSACNCRRTMLEHAGFQLHRSREGPAAHTHSKGSCQACIPRVPRLKYKHDLLYKLLSFSCVKVWALLSLSRAFLMQKKSPADQLVQLAICLASCFRNSAEQASINKLQMTQVFVARRRHDRYHSPQYCTFWLYTHLKHC